MIEQFDPQNHNINKLTNPLLPVGRPELTLVVGPHLQGLQKKRLAHLNNEL